MPLLITDLDNTLYDWVTYFTSYFKVVIKELLPIVGIAENQLLDEFKTIHQYYRNSEYPFAIFELPSIRNKFRALSFAELLQLLDSPLGALEKAQNVHLTLYPNVISTLQILNNKGFKIVGHTEATAENISFRIQKLDLSKWFHSIYALENNVPFSLSFNLETQAKLTYAGLNSGDYSLIRFIREEERKPNPKVILDICKRENVSPDEVWYLGDSLTRDISMANQAGIRSIWARYGTQYDPTCWNTLVRVTHWTEADVRREAELRKATVGLTPDFTIDSFSDLLKILNISND